MAAVVCVQGKCTCRNMYPFQLYQLAGLSSGDSGCFRSFRCGVVVDVVAVGFLES
jgi:hypothetical protein